MNAIVDHVANQVGGGAGFQIIKMFAYVNAHLSIHAYLCMLMCICAPCSIHVNASTCHYVHTA